MLHSTCCYSVCYLVAQFWCGSNHTEVRNVRGLGLGDRVPTSWYRTWGAEHSHPQSPSKGDSKEWFHLIPGNKRHIFLGPISSVNQIHLCHRIILGPELVHLLLKWLLLFFIMPQYLPMSIGPTCVWQSYLFSATSKKSSHYSEPSPDVQMSPAHRLQASSSLSALNIFFLFAFYCLGAVVK